MSTVSLVTGGNRGIGREVCRQLAERGHAVLLTARSAAAAAAAARATVTPNPSSSTSPIPPASPRRRAGRRRYAELDVLVNNAAITYDTWQRAVDADLAVVREAAETNLYGPWLMVQGSCRCCGPAVTPDRQRLQRGGLAGQPGRRDPGLHRVEGRPQRAHPDARRRTARRPDPGQRGLPRLGRHRHGRPGRPSGRSRRGQRGLGGDPARLRSRPAASSATAARSRGRHATTPGSVPRSWPGDESCAGITHPRGRTVIASSLWGTWYRKLFAT